MLEFVLPFLFPGSLVAAAIYIVMIRRKASQVPPPTDALSVSERIFIAITAFFGGIIIAGPIYYYGLRRPFPQKAKSVRYIVWFLFLAIIITAAAFYAWLQYSFRVLTDNTLPYSLEEYLEESDLEETRDLMSVRTRYQGQGYSIEIPSNWKESWGTGDGELFSTRWEYSNAFPALTVTWFSKTDSSYSEENALRNVQERPSEFVLSHPEIQGAVGQPNLIEGHLRNGEFDLFPTYSILLFAQGVDNKRYEVEATLMRPTPERVELLRQIVLSFRIGS